MATETQKLKKDLTPNEDNPKKTLETQDPPTKTSITNHLESFNALTQPSSPQLPSSTENLGADGSLKEGDESKGGDVSSTEATVGSPTANNAPVSDTQKKMRRAERFGMPVQFSEEEKRNSRAERFGTQPTLHGSNALTKSEELKRKARAERFGLPVQSVQSGADEDAKKKARLARFAPVSKTDGVEEDKRKARAIRFSQPPSSSPSHVNGKGNIEPEAAIAGKATGGA